MFGGVWACARNACLAAVFFAAMAVGAIDDLHETMLMIENEPDIGKAIYTFRYVPRKTQVVDQLIFECIYRQVVPVENSRGQKYERIHEPEVFRYIRRKEKFVEELDLFVNFRVPVRRDLITQSYARHAFVDDMNIVVDRVRVTAMVGTREAWQLEYREGMVYRRNAESGAWEEMPRDEQ